MLEYAASTTNNTNKVTATPSYEGDTVEIILGEETEVTNGQSATWEEGENTLTITVGTGEDARVYTVTVTKS